jgi:hypothetical protein
MLTTPDGAAPREVLFAKRVVITMYGCLVEFFGTWTPSREMCSRSVPATRPSTAVPAGRNIMKVVSPCFSNQHVRPARRYATG